MSRYDNKIREECIGHLTANDDFTEPTKIVVFGGCSATSLWSECGSGGDEPAMELLDFSNSTDICNTQLEFPTNVHSAVGGLLKNDVLFLCAKSVCYQSQNGESPVKIDVDMYVKGSASIVVENRKTLWITGGYKLNNQVTTTKTYLASPFQPNHFIRQGIELKKKVAHHCLIKLNDSVAVQIGGHINDYGPHLRDTWVYNIDNNYTRHPGPNLNKARSKHVCGIIKRGTDGTQTGMHINFAYSL